MKTKLKFSPSFKALLLAALLAGPVLAIRTLAITEVSETWAPQDILYDGNNSPYAYWNDPNNWSAGVVPTLQDTNNGDANYGDYYDAHFNDSAFDIIPCLVTNDTQVGQLVIGDYGGAGEVIVTNGASLQAGFTPGGGEWTGVGFPNGPGTLYVGPGSTFSCGSHLWVGNGGAAEGTVIIDGGTVSIPAGQLGVGWNGGGGTNYIFITNGASLFVDTWAGSTLGEPGSGVGGGLGIMDIGSGSSVVITNNQTGFFQTLVTNNQLIAYEGLGTVSWNYNPSGNITTILSTPPVTASTPIITAQPTNNVVAAGGTATFHVTISNVPVNYQWLFNNAPLTDGNGISGSHTATLTVANVAAAQVGNYSVTATNQTTPSSYVLSSVVSLSTETINLYPVITLNGVAGNTYVVQYATSLTPPVAWTQLGTYTLTGSTQFVVDTSSPRSVQRFYQVVQQ